MSAKFETGRRSRRRRALLACGAAMWIALLATDVQAAVDQPPSWNPQATERLINLPTGYLKKSIDRQFQESSLHDAIRQQQSDAGVRQQSIQDLQAALEMAEGEVRNELRHQILVGKEGLIQTLGAQTQFQRQEVQTRIDLYRKLLDQARSAEALTTVEAATLRESQWQARQRIESLAAEVDTAVFGSGAGRGKYAEQYARNQSRIDQLAAMINAHRMNRQPEIDGGAVDRATYLRRLIEDGETELALLDQREEVLGYMAKLVALDAMALHEDVADARMGADASDSRTGDPLDSAVDLFLTN